MTDGTAFMELAEPFRPELLVHCYRMLGSVDDAEDLVQETYLRAWRAYDSFEGRSSLRTWLYKIATSACLSALDHRSRRFLPSGLGAPSEDPDTPTGLALDHHRWVQPLPGVNPHSWDPASIVAQRGSVRLALVAALQHLPPRQRAVLILRDVLAWRAAEVAELLETSPTAVNSALQRARAQLELVAPREDQGAVRLDPARQALLDRYVKAFENADIEALIEVLRHDVTLEMPPEVTWFAGRTTVARFIADVVFPALRTARVVVTTANDGPALATYAVGGDGLLHAHAIQVIGVSAEGITGITAFRDPRLFRHFALPPALSDDESARSWRT